MKAANFLQSQIGSATGAYPEVVTDIASVKWTSSSKLLVLAIDSIEKQADVVWSTEYISQLGYSGYMIKTVGDSVFFKVNTNYGYQQAVISFLREVLGYEWFGEDVITFENDGETLPDLDIIEKPDIDLTYSSSTFSSASKYASGLTDIKVFAPTDGIDFHNTYVILSYRKYCNPDKPSTYHPKWYSDKWGNYHNIFGETNTPSEYQPGQLCYTAHGDYNEYQLMLQTAAAGLLEYIKASPEASTITFTQQDTDAVCDCAVCSACVDHFGSISSTLLMFCNDLEDVIRNSLEEEAAANGTEPRKITLLFFAYQKTKNAAVSGSLGENNYVVPAYDATDGITNKRGDKVLLPYNKDYKDGLHTNDNVGVFFADTSARYNDNFYADVINNKQVLENLEKWGLLSNQLYVWTYDTNFKHYFMPYNSYDNIVETVRALKDNNASFYFAQSQDWENSYHPVFGMLKRYIVSKVRYNVNMDYNEAVDKFFAAYFKDAAKPMREYFDKLTAYLEYLEDVYPSTFTGGIYDDFIETSVYWPISLMTQYLDLCDQAYKKIEKYKTSAPATYEVLVRNIKIETMFPRFMICEYFPGMYSSTEIQKMREEFYDDCQELKMMKYSEGTYLKPYFEKWGVA